MFLDTPQWKKFSLCYTCAGSIGAGAYIYFLIPKAEASSVGEALDRAGFDGIEKASAADLRMLVAAYKAASKKNDFKPIEGAEIQKDDTDEEIAQKMVGGCRRLFTGSTSATNNENGRRFCVVPITVEETLSKKRIRFLDTVGSGDDSIWTEKVKLLIDNGKAGASMKSASDEKARIGIIKSSCSDLKTAPTTSGKFKSFIDVAETYCTVKI